MENEQDSQRRDGEQEEPQLEARRHEPLRRRPSSELYQLDETVREDVRRADRDNWTDDDRTTSNCFKAAHRRRRSVADQRDRRGDDTAEDRGLDVKSNGSLGTRQAYPRFAGGGLTLLHVVALDVDQLGR